MGGYRGYGKQSDFMKQIIQELDGLIVKINDVDENIYSEKLYTEWGASSKRKVSDFILKNLDSNETLLFQLEKINCNVMAESELKEAIEKLVQFCNKIKELLKKSKNLDDFNKWLELSIYKEELGAKKEEINYQNEELNNIINNAKSQINNELKEFYNKKLLRSETLSFENSEIISNKNAIKWLKASGLIAFLLILFVFCMSNNVNGLVGIKKALCCISKYDQTILYIAYAKYISSYVLIYSILIYALKVSIKNYNANKHNEIVNRNKKLTLTTANILSSEGKNPQLLDIAAKELFTPQSTGYINTTDEKSTSNIVNTIVDTISK